MTSRLSTHDVVNQTPPFAPRNLVTSDTLLRTLADPIIGPGGEDEAIRFGHLWGTSETLELARLANLYPPRLRTHDGQGRRLDVVDFHPAYHALMRRSAKAGLHCASWQPAESERGHASFHRAMRLYLVAQVECGHLVSPLLTHAVAGPLLQKRIAPTAWEERLLARDYDHRFAPVGDKSAISLGLGIAEKQAGNDAASITTGAVPALSASGAQDRFSLTGHKWALSAPMSDGFVILAQTEAGPSAFLVPRFREDGNLNGLRFQQVKETLGARSSATVEAEFADAEGFLLGDMGAGLKTISSSQTLLRLDNAILAAALMRSSLARAVHHARYRVAFGREILAQPLMARVLCDLALDVAGATALALMTADLIDQADQSDEAAIYAKVMIPALKYWITKTAPTLLAETAEAIGGNAFNDEQDSARAYRDALLPTLWEGTGNLLCLDVLNVLRESPRALDIVLSRIAQGLGSTGPASVDVLHAAARACLQDEGSARILTEQLALTAAAACLQSCVPRQIADAFIDSRLAGQWRATYGMLDARFDFAGIIDYLYPEQQIS